MTQNYEEVKGGPDMSSNWQVGQELNIDDLNKSDISLHNR